VDVGLSRGCGLGLLFRRRDRRSRFFSSCEISTRHPPGEWARENAILGNIPTRIHIVNAVLGRVSEPVIAVDKSGYRSMHRTPELVGRYGVTSSLRARVKTRGNQKPPPDSQKPPPPPPSSSFTTTTTTTSITATSNVVLRYLFPRHHVRLPLYNYAFSLTLSPATANPTAAPSAASSTAFPRDCP
jgi:hypothetical protein